MTGTKNETSTGGRQVRPADAARIAKLEAQIAAIREREEAKQRKEDPLQKETAKMQRQLRKFATFAAKHSRLDIANSVTAWVASLDRMTRDDRLRPAKLDLDEDDEPPKA